MARLRLIGDVAQVQLTRDEDGGVTAGCILHKRLPGHVWPCRWTERYNNMRDAVEYAAVHADRGTQ